MPTVETAMKTVYLVSCVSRKASVPKPAEELYESDWFCKARKYVAQRLRPSDVWFILSAEHFLLAPNQIVEPYNTTLNTMGRQDRRRWSANVLEQIRSILGPGDTVVLIAGQRYRETLVPFLRAAGHTVEVPMEGMPIGKQKAWLLAQVRHERPL